MRYHGDYVTRYAGQLHLILRIMKTIGMAFTLCKFGTESRTECFYFQVEGDKHGTRDTL